MLPTLGLLLACSGGEDTAGRLQWWEDPCGRRDPVGHECKDGIETVEVGDDPTCADQGIVAGSECAEAGETCIALRPIACADDPKTIIGSDAVLTCGTQPPDSDCPISLRARKEDIAYLDAAARAAVADDVLTLPLATYRYREPARDGVGTQLGFVLEDAPAAPFSTSDHVNLYAYASAILAAVQLQQEEIVRLRAQVDALEQSCANRPR
jgi:hypothetical protein